MIQNFENCACKTAFTEVINFSREIMYSIKGIMLLPSTWIVYSGKGH